MSENDSGSAGSLCVATLLSADEQSHFLIRDSTLVELLSGLMVDDRTDRHQRLVALGFKDAGWAAWLVDQASDCYRRKVLSDSTRAVGAFPAEPPFWTLIESRVKRLLNGSELDRHLLDAIASIDLPLKTISEWNGSNQAVRAHCYASFPCGPNASRSLAELGPQRSAFYWWACYLGVRHWDRLTGEVELGVWEPAKAGDDSPSKSEFANSEALVELTRKILIGSARLADLESEFSERLEREKLAAMKELAYGASHEINNPLANISSRAQILLRDEVDEKRRRALASINRQAFRAHEMIADMMLFAKPPQLEFESVCWDEWVDSLTCGLEEECPDTIEIQIDHDSNFAEQIYVDATQLEVAVRAIFKNAVEAVGEQGQIVLRTRLQFSTAGDVDSLLVEISDDGPGITPEVRRHLFDPFYSGREAGRGLGFGLSKAWRIAELHGGDVLVESRPGRTVIGIRVPANVDRAEHQTGSTLSKS